MRFLQYFSLFLTALSICQAQVPVAEFFPFGVEEGDTVLTNEDDGSSPPFYLEVEFPFANFQETKLWVNTNGVITFARRYSSFTPECKALGVGTRMVIPYWTDIDMRNGGSAFYRQSKETALLRKANSEVVARYPNLIGIDLKLVFIATWYDVGLFKGGTNNRLTFQSIMATDGTRSFAIFYFHKTASSKGFNGHAKVGFDLGDGVHTALVEGSCTENIRNITQLSNMNRPGKFVFQIDSSNISTANCDDLTYNKQKLTVEPVNVADIARSTVSFQGPCFPLDANITCVFDTIHKGVKRINGFVELSSTGAPIAYCKTPYFYGYGRYMVEVHVKTSNYSSKYKAFLTVSKFVPELEVVFDRSWDSSEIDLYSKGHFLQFSWRPENFDADETLELGLTWIDPDTEDYAELLMLSRIIPNTGSHVVHLSDRLPEGVTIDLLVKSVGSFFLRPTTVSPKDFALLKRQVSLFFSKLKPQRKESISTSWEYLAELWTSRLESIGEETFCNVASLGKPVTNVLRCPCTREQAEVDCNFERNGQSKEELQQFHPGASSSYRQIVPKGNNNRAMASCVYDSEGFFKSSAPGGSIAYRFHPEGCHLDSGHWKCANVPLHLLHDIVPYFGCCKMSDNCRKYYEHRSPGDCNGLVDCRPAQCNGDPHITTFDLLRYTFNGNGEFILVEDASNHEFLVQARMEPLGSNTATVFTAFAIRHSGTVVQLQRSSRGNFKVDILVDGQMLDQGNSTESSIIEQQLGPMTVRSLANDWSVVSVSLTSGLSFQFTTSDIAMSVISTASKNFKNSGRLRGLLGDFDGDEKNDLKTPNGNVLSPNSNLSDIHWNFGMKWIVDQPHSSLFQYGPGKSFEYYHQPTFRPILDLPNLKTVPPEAKEICGQSIDCLFDYSASDGDLKLVNQTVLQNKKFDKTIAIVDTIVSLCPGLTKHKNGYFIQSNGSFIGSVVTFYCDANFELTGLLDDTNNATCDNATLKWKPEGVPHCHSPSHYYFIIPAISILLIIAICLTIYCLFFKDHRRQPALESEEIVVTEKLVENN